MRKSSSSFRGRSIDFRGRQSTTVVEPAAGSGRHPEGRDAEVELGGDARGRAEQQQRGRPQDCHGGGGEEGGDGVHSQFHQLFLHSNQSGNVLSLSCQY